MMLSNNGLFTLVKEASLHESDNTIDKFMTDRLLHCTMDKKSVLRTNYIFVLHSNFRLTNYKCNGFPKSMKWNFYFQILVFSLPNASVFWWSRKFWANKNDYCICFNLIQFWIVYLLKSPHIYIFTCFHWIITCVKTKA